MTKTHEHGSISGLALGFIAVCVAFIVAVVLAFSAYSGEQKYKNNDQILINQAVQVAEAKQAAQLAHKFKIESENPFTSYTGPSQYGSVYIAYPKNWSGYVDTNGGNPLEGYFSPGVVPSVSGAGNIFPLRVEINSNSYSSQLSQYTGEQTSLKLNITPYTLKKVPSVTGVMITGAFKQNRQGIMVMFPLRTDTLSIWTDSMQYANIFTNQILPNVSFSP